MPHRVSVLLAVDDLQALFRTSLYRNAEFEHVEAYHLSLPRLVLDFASGKKSFVSLTEVGVATHVIK